MVDRFGGRAIAATKRALARWVVIVAVCAGGAAPVLAAPWKIDVNQSFLTAGGMTYGEDSMEPVLPQPGSSATEHFSGTLLVDLRSAGNVRIVGSSIQGIPQTGSFEPFGATSADYALQAYDLRYDYEGYGTIARSSLFTKSESLPVDGAGNFDAGEVVVRMASNDFGLYISYSTMAKLRFSMANLADGPASLTQVGDQYRMVIPFEGVGELGGIARLTFSGQLVATRPVAGALAPDVVNGGFEDNGGWVNVNPGTPGNQAAIQSVGPGFVPRTTEGVNGAYMNVLNDTVSMYQTIIPAGELQPNTKYAITFDVGNRDVTDNGNLPNNDMDPFISARGFFTLGDGLVDFSQHVGQAYELAQLSTLADGTWAMDNQIVLDTSLLTPEQLALPLHFVLQATSTTTMNVGQVDFDNVRLTVVPEPSTLVLAAGALLALIGVRRSRRGATQ